MLPSASLAVVTFVPPIIFILSPGPTFLIVESSAPIPKLVSVFSSTYFLVAASCAFVGSNNLTILVPCKLISPTTSNNKSFPDCSVGVPAPLLCILGASITAAVMVPVLVIEPVVPVIATFCTLRVFVPLFHDKPLDVFTSVVPVAE